MSIGIVVDGDAESQALRGLTNRLVGARSIVGPFYADMQPLAPPPAIARAAVKTIQIAKARGATEIIVLIDRETNDSCPPEIAVSLEDEFDKLGHAATVVIKNRAFENWLIADPNALSSQRRRFSVSNAVRNRVVPNKADHIDNAQALLDQCAIKTPYHKRKDAQKICERIDIGAAAANSRSLRKFLNAVDDERYRNQSKLP